MARYLHTMYRLTDPARSRVFYEALGLRFSNELDIVRNGCTIRTVGQAQPWRDTGK